MSTAIRIVLRIVVLRFAILFCYAVRRVLEIDTTRGRRTPVSVESADVLENFWTKLHRTRCVRFFKRATGKPYNIHYSLLCTASHPAAATDIRFRKRIHYNIVRILCLPEAKTITFRERNSHTRYGR